MNGVIATLLVAALPAAGVAQVELLSDMRATHDTSLLDPAAAFDRFVVLRVIPSPGSGAMHNAEAAIVESGAWGLLDDLGARGVARRGTFRWSKPLRAHVNKLEAEDYYSPFSSGGIILCELDESRTGSEQFRRVCLLPESWAQAPARAFAKLRQRPDVLRDFRSVAASGEPLLAAMAFRRLLRTHPNAVEVDRLIAGSSGFVRAELVYLALRERSAAEPALRRAVRPGASPAEPQFTALGIFTAWLLDPTVAQDCPWTTDVLAAIERSVPRDDPYFGPLFRIVGLPGIESR